MDLTNLRALDSATKYPEIVTYHALERGILQEDQATVYPPGEKVLLTEKANGTGVRVIYFPGGDWIIGARDHLLSARGDRIWPKDNGVVDLLRPVAESLANFGQLTVLYLEVYGGKIGKAARQYTSHEATGYRLFDAATINRDILELPVPEIARLRDNGNLQRWFTEEELNETSHFFQNIPLVPRLGEVDALDLPTGIQETQAFLTQYLPATNIALDSDAHGDGEGIVLRTADRRVITKARFEDYSRTLTKRAEAERLAARYENG